MEATGNLSIGQASKASGVSEKMIRHYESLGLLLRVRRSASGYRQYTANEVHTLRFIRRARHLGFGIGEIATLLGLWQNQLRSSAEVKRLALTHAAELGTRILELQEMKRALEQLAGRCHGNERPDCPILDGLAADTGSSTGASRSKAAATRFR